MRTARLFIGAALATAALACLPASASAATFCINRPGCSGVQTGTIQGAIDAAKGSPGLDAILVGPGRYAGQLIDRNGNPVVIEGLGTSTSIVNADGTGSAGPVVVLQDPSSVLRGVSVGLSPGTGQPVRRAVVSGPGGQIEDATVNGPIGISDLSAARRVRIGASTTGATAVKSISDSVVRIAGDGVGVEANFCPAWRATNLTIVGDGTTAGTGVAVYGPNPIGCPLASPFFDLTNTIISNVRTTIRHTGSALHVSYSNFDPARVLDTGGTYSADHNGNEDPHFVLGLSGEDYRLGYDSPLVDVGGPRSSGDGDLDAGRRTRVVDGHADGTPQVDIGAWEYQDTGPTASIGVNRSVVDPGDEITFFAVSRDPDDPFPSFSWAYGDGTTDAHSARVQHSYEHPGTFTAYVRVTDHAGHTAIAHRSITVRPYCRVPRLRGHSLSAARRLLARSHCRLGLVRRHGSTHVRRGRIVSQRPSGDARRRFGARVNVTLSTGRRHR